MAFLVLATISGLHVSSATDCNPGFYQAGNGGCVTCSDDENDCEAEMKARERQAVVAILSNNPALSDEVSDQGEDHCNWGNVVCTSEAVTALRLFANQLTSLSPEIGQLQSLSSLDLSYNKLTSLPPEIGQLQSLTELGLASNQLTSLPPEIGQLAVINRARFVIQPAHLSPSRDWPAAVINLPLLARQPAHLTPSRD